jgi:hypothetical protein
MNRLSDAVDAAERASNINLTSLHLSDPDDPNDQFGLVATAARANSGRIQVIAWRLAEDGSSITRLGDSGELGPAVNGVAAVRLSFQRIATAVRTQQGRLQVIIWRVRDNGNTVELLGQSETPPEMAIASSELSIETMNAGQVVTVARNAEGRIIVRNWGVSVDGMTVNPAGNGGVTGEVVTEFAALRPFIGRLVTAYRTGAGRLQLHSWATPPGEDPTPLLASDPGAAGDGRQISAVIGGDIVTAVRTVQGNLKLIRWNGALEREGDSGDLGGPASRTSVIALNGDFYLTATRGEGGDLQVDSWQVNPTSTEIDRTRMTAEEDQEPVGEVAFGRVFGPMVITAVQDASAHLKLIAWQP